MPLTIVATPGSASANSFVTLAEFSTWLESVLRPDVATVVAAATDDKNRALVEATRKLTRLPWVGTRVDSTQALSWPRSYAVDPDAPVIVAPEEVVANQDVYFDDDEIPQRIKNATFEYAYQLLQDDSTDYSALSAATNIKREKVDVLETEYFEQDETPQGLDRFGDLLHDEIHPLLDGAGETELVRV